MSVAEPGEHLGENVEQLVVIPCCTRAMLELGSRSIPVDTARFEPDVKVVE
ncbi:MAG: hypothetical protein AAFU70_12445 [Planctomycetota bacterium]